MTVLRQRMIEDMQLRGLAARTQEAYVAAVEQLAKYCHKPPDEIGEEELRQYLLYLQNEKRVSASTMTVTLCAIRFLYQHTLQREWHLLDLARAKQEKTLPAVLSVEEVARVLGCVHQPRYSACLTTIYACGLRIQEGVYLQVGDIDDATGKVLFLHFRPTEDQIGYLPLLRAVAQRYGLPMSIYHDRHTILRSPKQPTLEEELAGQRPMSQIQRVMAELGIESVLAYSPQAKGRIERLRRTLHDRLTKELRLAGITTLEAANAWLSNFIARYNARFAKLAADHHDVWVPLPVDFDFNPREAAGVNYYYLVRETRKVRADHCISYQGKPLQLLPNAKTSSLVAQTITVHRVPEGDIHVYHGKQPIPHRPVEAHEPGPARPIKVSAPAKPPDPKAAARRRGWLYGQP